MTATAQQASYGRVGDVIAIHGHRLGETGRLGEIVEVLGEGIHEHYLVRWDDGHESVFYPGSDTTLRRASRQGTRKEQS